MNKNDISNLISELRAVYKLGPKVLNVNIYNHNRKLRNKLSFKINAPYTNTKDQIITHDYDCCQQLHNKGKVL